MNTSEPHRHGDVTGRKAGVVIASTRAAAGLYRDETGPVIIDWLTEHGFEPYPAMVVPDGEPVGAAIRALLTQRPAVVITSGGTGLNADDLTPEMTLPLLDREIPGIMEGMRQAGRAKTPMAMLSRGYAGAAGSTFIVNLPGSPKGVMDGLTVLDPVIGHLCDQLREAMGIESGFEVVHAVLSEQPISVDQAIAAVESDTAGAVVSFSGVVRNHDGGKAVERLSYSAHPTAHQIMTDVVAQLVAEYSADTEGPAVRIWAAHRVGTLEIGDPALVCAVSAAHRGQAFAVCSELVDRIKEQVPIWKEQFFSDGTVEWVGAGA